MYAPVAFQANGRDLIVQQTDVAFPDGPASRLWRLDADTGTVQRPPLELGSHAAWNLVTTATGTIDLQLEDNVLTGSLLAPALVTFTRNDAVLDPGALSRWQYLHDATFAIRDPQGTLADAWIDHPETDPYLGPCQGDATNEALGNTLRYNGADLPSGRNFQYSIDAERARSAASRRSSRS